MSATPIWFVSPQNFDAVRGQIGEMAAGFAAACGFEPKPGRMQLLPAPDGGLAGVVFGDDPDDPLAAGKLATSLPPGTYRFATPPTKPELAALAFQLARYRFDRFKAAGRPAPSLEAEATTNFSRLERIAEAIAQGRDLINLPANVLTPSALERAATDLARTNSAPRRAWSSARSSPPASR